MNTTRRDGRAGQKKETKYGLEATTVVCLPILMYHTNQNVNVDVSEHRVGDVGVRTRDVEREFKT